MTDKADDVFGDDDPFENLEERLADAFGSADLAAPEPVGEAHEPHDAELRLVMERIKSRAKTSPLREPDRANEPPQAHRDEPVLLDDSVAVDEARSRGNRAAMDARVASPGNGAEFNDEDQPSPFDAENDGSAFAFARKRRQPDSAGPKDLATRTEADLGEEHPLVDTSSDDLGQRDTGSTPSPKTLPASAAGAPASSESIWVTHITGETEIASTRPRSDGPAEPKQPEGERSRQLAAPATPEKANTDELVPATFGSLVAGPRGARGDSDRSETAGKRRRFEPDPSSQARQSPIPTAPPSKSPQVSVEQLALPPSGVTAVLPVASAGLAPGSVSPEPPASQQIDLRVHNRAQRSATDSGSRDRERSNSRGLLFIAGGITLIILSMLVYVNYFLGSDTETPTQDMAPTADAADPDDSVTTFTSATEPTVEVTGCDSEAAHVVVTSQSATPVVAVIRFAFVKDGEIYYEEDSETPRVTAGEPLTKSLLLIGKDIPSEYAGVDPDDCTAEVVRVNDA